VKRIRPDERGSSLLIALIFLALFSLWVSTTLASAESGLHIGQTMKVEPKRLYAADGAIEQAIQKVRFVAARGVEGDTACDTTASLNGKTYYVQCQPQDGSGQSPYGGSSPSLGIIALTNGAGGEVGYTQRKNGVIRIDGGVFSNSGISFQNGSVCPGTNCQQLNLCPNNTKTVTDAIFVAAPSGPNTPSKTVTSFSAGFLSDPATETDVGAPIAHIPPAGQSPQIAGGATIASIAGPTTITMSATASAVGLNKKVTFRENFPPYNNQCHPTDVSHGEIRVVGAPCNQSNVVAVTFHCNASALDPLNLTDPNFPPDATTAGAGLVATNGTTALVGTGTAFTDTFKAGDTVTVAGETVRTIAAVADNTHLTVTAAFSTTGPARTYLSARTIPACPSGRIVDFLPGRYTDVVKLNNLTSSCGSTPDGNGKVLYFHSGTYNFDFSGAAPAGPGTVATSGTSALVGTGTTFTNTFKVGDAITVAGETARTVATITDNTHLTVTAAFATTASGLTYLSVDSPVWYMGNSKSWILAGEKNFDQIKTDAATSNTGLLYGTMNKNSTTLSSGTPVFKQSDVGSFISGGIELPYGAKIVSVPSNKGGKDAILDKAPDSKITSGLFAVTGSSVDAPCDKRTGNDHPGAEFILSGPSRIQMGDMRFEMCSPVSGNRQQNALYGAKDTVGDLIAQNGCISAQPYPGVGCAMLSTESNRAPMLVIHGTIYAPRAAVDLAVKSFSYQAVSRGIVARVVALEMFPNAVFTNPVIYSPDFGTVVGADREMLFVACENGTAGNKCPSGKPKLRAMIRFQDHDEYNNLVIGHTVKVDSWTVLRG
jgi:hypothetical protein